MSQRLCGKVLCTWFAVSQRCATDTLRHRDVHGAVCRHICVLTGASVAQHISEQGACRLTFCAVRVQWLQVGLERGTGCGGFG
jgi:hypothetical protein